MRENKAINCTEVISTYVRIELHKYFMAKKNESSTNLKNKHRHASRQFINKVIQGELLTSFSQM